METQLLKNKNALVFGAKGALGKQVARTFKENGAAVYLSDLNIKGESEESDLGIIRKLDTLDEKQVKTYFQWFVKEKKQIDVVINLSSTPHAAFKHGESTSLLSLDQFLIPMRNFTGAQFLTAKVASGIMAEQKSGVILFITSTLAKVGAPFFAALSASHAATEGLARSLAHEWGQQGIRVVCVRSGAMPETPTIDYTFETMGRTTGMTKEQIQDYIIQQKTALKRVPSTAETANVLAFAASDMASYMTGTVLNSSGGEIVD